jgi:hypothetical protein
VEYRSRDVRGVVDCWVTATTRPRGWNSGGKVALVGRVVEKAEFTWSFEVR